MKYFCAFLSLSVLLLLPELAFSQGVNEVFSFSNAHTSATPELVTPIQGRDGGIYGTTSGIGMTVTDGSIFRIAIGGKLTALHNFSGADGEFPYASPTLGIDGNYYGTTVAGGSSNSGVLYKVTPSGTYSVLYEFAGGSDGAYPHASPIQASDGNLYGTTDAGNSNSGVVYRYTLSSGAFSTIFSFNADKSQGAQVFDPLIQGADGNLYGTAEYGGANLCGTIFELSISGTLLQLYSFPGGTGGDAPGHLMQAADGNFYGVAGSGGQTTSQCGAGCGTIFKLSQGVITTLYSFSGPPNDGANPNLGGLVEGSDGNLYGATYGGGTLKQGTLFQVGVTGKYKVLYSFAIKYGQNPGGGLLQHTSGKFYGTTFIGGVYNEGSLYSLNMGLGPFIALVRYTGRVGQPVQILGQGLTGSTVVTVNGVTATSFKVASSTYMTAIIPAGATSGPVVVTAPTGTLTSNHNLRIVQ
jgi:uncharacterized repeat protein (TIGR03803 family)